MDIDNREKLESMTLGELLKFCRTEIVEVPLKTIKKKTSIDPATVSKYENDKKKPNHHNLYKLVDYFRTNDVPEWILKFLQEKGGSIVSPIPISDVSVAYKGVLDVNQLFSNLKNDEHKESLHEILITSGTLYQKFREGQKCNDKRYWGKAIENLRRSIKGIDKLQKLFGGVFLEEGKALYGGGDHIAAIESFNEAMRRFDRYKETVDDEEKKEVEYERGKIGVRLGDAHRRLGHWDSALRFYKKAEKIFTSSHIRSSRSQVAICIRKQGAVYNFRGLGDKGEELCKESLALFKEINDDVGIYKAWQHIAWSYLLQGKWDEAIGLREQAMEKLEIVTDDHLERMKALIYIGDSYRLIGDLEKAKKKYQEARDEFDKANELGVDLTPHKILLKIGLGKVYVKDPANLDRARTLLHSALTTSVRSGEEYRTAMIKNELGALLLEHGQLDGAKSRLNSSKESFIRLGVPFYACDCNVMLCEIYQSRGDFEAMISASDEVQSMHKAQNFNAKVHLAKIHFIMAVTALDNDKYATADKYFRRAVRNALGFNEYVFNEIVDKLTAKAKSLFRDGNAAQANSLLELGIDFSGDGKLGKDGAAHISNMKTELRKLKEEYSPLPSNDNSLS